MALFITCFFIGIVAVPAGIVVCWMRRIIGGFFPFHLNFVRGAGLLVALASALAAGPHALARWADQFASALPLALISRSLG